MDLEVPRADRRLHPVPVATRLGERPCDGGLRGAVETQDRSTALRRSLQHPPDGRGLERARPQALELARRAGQHHDDGRARRYRARSPGAVPASPRESAPSGSVACLVTPVANSVYGLPMRSANVREIASICCSRPASTTSARPATRATISTVRSSWVGTEPTGDEAEIGGREPSASAALEILRAGRRRS